MASNSDQPLNIDLTELSAIAKIAQRKLQKYAFNIPGHSRNRSIINTGNEYAGLREYCPGDEVRSINWHASARNHQFQVHQYQKESGNRWFICLDNSASMTLPDHEKWRLSIQMSAAFAYLLITNGHQVGLISFNNKVDHYYPLGKGRNHYYKLLQLLQQIQPLTEGGCSQLQHCIPQVSQRSSVLVISDFLQAGFMSDALNEFLIAGHPLHAIQVLSPQECQLNTSGYLSVQDIETGESITIDASIEQQSIADKTLEQLKKDIALYCAKHHIHFTQANTRLTWKDVLLDYIGTL